MAKIFCCYFGSGFIDNFVELLYWCGVTEGQYLACLGNSEESRVPKVYHLWKTVIVMFY